MRDDQVVVEETPTELELKDAASGLVVATIRLGDLIPHAGVWFRVIQVKQDEVTIKPEAYTGKRIRRLVRT